MRTVPLVRPYRPGPAPRAAPGPIEARCGATGRSAARRAASVRPSDRASCSLDPLRAPPRAPLLDVVSVVGQHLEDHPDEYEELLKLLTPQDSQLAGGGSE